MALGINNSVRGADAERAAQLQWSRRQGSGQNPQGKSNSEGGAASKAMSYMPGGSTAKHAAALLGLKQNASRKADFAGKKSGDIKSMGEKAAQFAVKKAILAVLWPIFLWLLGLFITLLPWLILIGIIFMIILSFSCSADNPNNALVPC